jgi:D-alanyl-lipoteichoic acid acyltransferase DltB (MBOAT superfamily)
MLWGLFKKVVIADNCATHVDYIFSNVDTVSPTMLWFGALLFTFQIYCDFSGYSDIAIGLSRLFGFSLMKNFHYPYISRNITEFWQRWHISLSTWFRDYVYIPLGGGRVSKILHFRNIMTIFIVSGFWHGANWTFIFWGFLHGCYYIPLIFSKKKSLSEYPAYDKLFPSRLEISQILQTFFIVMIAWVFFRAENIGQAFYYISRMFEFKNLGSFAFINTEILMLLIFIGILMLSEWRQRDKEHPLVLINQPLILNWSIYIILSLVIIQEFTGQQSFIYFQF